MSLPIEIPDEAVETVGAAIAKVVVRELRAHFAEASPWMNMDEAIVYSKVPDSTFRKRVAAGEIRSHGGKTKIFHKQELDQDLGHVPLDGGKLRAA